MKFASRWTTLITQGAFALALLCAGCAADARGSHDGVDLSSVSTTSGEIRNGTPTDVPPPSDPPPTRTPRAPAPDQLYSDLRPTGALRFSDSLTSLEVEVVNVGTAPAVGLYGTIKIAGYELDSSLYADGAPMTNHTLVPQQVGYISAHYLRRGLIQACVQYRVIIDTLHEMQQAPAGIATAVYANDSAVVKTPCTLTWTSPITEGTLYGVYPDQIVGDTTCSTKDCNNAADVTQMVSDGTALVDQSIRGKTIADIVGSFTTGRVDNLVCSECHFDAPGRNPDIKYVPPVPHLGSAPIGKDDLILDLGGTSVTDSDCLTCGTISSTPRKKWSGANGWAEAFSTVRYPPDATMPFKHPFLRAVFAKWVSDGYQ